MVTLVGTEIRSRPVDPITPTAIDDVAGCLQHPGRAALDAEETERAIAAMLTAEDRASRP